MSDDTLGRIMVVFMMALLSVPAIMVFFMIQKAVLRSMIISDEIEAVLNLIREGPEKWDWVEKDSPSLTAINLIHRRTELRLEVAWRRIIWIHFGSAILSSVLEITDKERRAILDMLGAYNFPPIPKGSQTTEAEEKLKKVESDLSLAELRAMARDPLMVDDE